MVLQCISGANSPLSMKKSVQYVKIDILKIELEIAFYSKCLISKGENTERCTISKGSFFSAEVSQFIWDFFQT